MQKNKKEEILIGITKLKEQNFMQLLGDLLVIVVKKKKKKKNTFDSSIIGILWNNFLEL